jgi:xanthine dehydrogenase YagT iron-sulfur-binding subunit
MKKSPEKKAVPKDPSRRAFLKGAGVTTAGTVAISSGLLSFTTLDREKDGRDVLGPGEVGIQMMVNGKKYDIAVEPRMTLTEAIREKLHLTGTKVGCDRGSCSACTVMMNGKPVVSCLVLAIDADGAEITTVEGLAKGDQLHPVQEAFIEHDATMCGFCTPGMVMSCAALLDRNPNPSLEDVKQATSGNLCRCGTYPKVFEATLAAAKKL